MHHLLFPSSTYSSMPPTSSKTTPKSPPNPNGSNNGNPQSLLLCKHSPSATLDLLILILVLFSGTFLLSSYFSYLFNSLSLLLSQFPSLSLTLPTFLPLLSSLNPHNDDDHDNDNNLPPASYFFAFTVFFAVSLAFLDSCCGPRSRKCHKPGCKGLKKAMEFDLQLQTEDCVKSRVAKEIDGLPWKGGSETNPDYECLRAELRKMAPPNGRAVLLFRARCGCSVAKLEGWGPKRSRRHKRALANLGLNGGVNR